MLDRNKSGSEIENELLKILIKKQRVAARFKIAKILIEEFYQCVIMFKKFKLILSSIINVRGILFVKRPVKIK